MYETDLIFEREYGEKIEQIIESLQNELSDKTLSLNNFDC